MCDMTHSYVWHDAFTRETSLLHRCNVTHSQVQHDSFTGATWLIHDIICDMTHFCFWLVTWLIMTHSWHHFFFLDLWHDSLWLIQDTIFFWICDMTHHDSFMTPFFLTCDMTHYDSFMTHFFFGFVKWLIMTHPWHIFFLICDMTHYDSFMTRSIHDMSCDKSCHEWVMLWQVMSQMSHVVTNHVFRCASVWSAFLNERAAAMLMRPRCHT